MNGYNPVPFAAFQQQQTQQAQHPQQGMPGQAAGSPQGQRPGMIPSPQPGGMGISVPTTQEELQKLMRVRICLFAILFFFLGKLPPDPCSSCFAVEKIRDAILAGVCALGSGFQTLIAAIPNAEAAAWA